MTLLGGPPFPFIFLFFLLLLAIVSPLALAQDDNPGNNNNNNGDSNNDSTVDSEPAAPQIFNDASVHGYAYHGCYNETTGMGKGTTGTRALYDGTHTVREKVMTATMCQEFCKASGTTYQYAGVEFAR